MKKPDNCPRCNHPIERNCVLCQIYFYYDNAKEVEQITLYFAEGKDAIYIYLIDDPETVVGYRGSAFVISSPLPELMFKSEEELLSWIKTMIIFQ